VKTFHVLILAGAILGAAWILKPVPVEQVSQVELQRREDAERRFQRLLDEEKLKGCLESMSKTAETLDLKDPQQEAAYRKCMWPEESQSRLRRIWNRMISALIW
jgi:hypothetical protein